MTHLNPQLARGMVYGLLVPKKINGLVWFGFSINGLVSARFGFRTRVYRFGLKVYRFLVTFFITFIVY